MSIDYTVQIMFLTIFIVIFLLFFGTFERFIFLCCVTTLGKHSNKFVGDVRRCCSLYTKFEAVGWPQRSTEFACSRRAQTRMQSIIIIVINESMEYMIHSVYALHPSLPHSHSFGACVRDFSLVVRSLSVRRYVAVLVAAIWRSRLNTTTTKIHPRVREINLASFMWS